MKVSCIAGNKCQPLEIPNGEASHLSHCSKFYHTNTEEADLRVPIKKSDAKIDGEDADEKPLRETELVFPDQV